MAKFNLQTGQISDTKIDLDALLSDTKVDNISATKDVRTNNEFSATKTEDISATKVSDTKISATKVSATNYMNNYKREKYDTIRIDFPKGAKEMLKQEASKRNLSVTKLIKTALAEYLKEK